MRKGIPVVFFLLVFGFSVNAGAHIYTLEYSPEPDSTLNEPPKKVMITLVGSVEPAFSRIEVFSSDGEKVSGKTSFKEDDTIMETELKENLPPGKYTVKWKCMSLDGHLQKKEFVFFIKK
jgi:methionine-rich copper-binding protein CopC